MRKATTPNADKASLINPSRGGYDNKYRKLRGIGEFSKRKQGFKEGTELSFGTNVGNADNGQSDKGEYP